MRRWSSEPDVIPARASAASRRSTGLPERSNPFIRLDGRRKPAQSLTKSPRGAGVARGCAGDIIRG
ncbi:hypothetical protein SAMN05216337_1002294 [Bradyrhizobium brasilense]|uniref:Uncharacterized protein n=1 Tax=Bradyrhizobium brasilense TaxID=1419277 RepID=A0A1G6L1T7_9BRAD|nr:hypothetical protein SAMN05216337_1002294 [Bradyrhizobium brasilense]